MAPPVETPPAAPLGLIRWVQRVARHMGGVRLLALPLLRAMAILAGVVWVALTPATYPSRAAVAAAVAAFAAYGLALYVLIWLRPRLAFRLHLLVLLLDLGFALALIRLSAGAHSTLYLALLLIAGVQSYYYGMARGVAVAAGASAAYIAVIWPTVAADDVANIAIRIGVLVGTAVVAGILADVEERERLEIARLGHEAHLREEFVRNVVDSLRDGLVVLDRDGRVVSWNRAMEARYAVPAGQARGKPVADDKTSRSPAPVRRRDQG